MWRESQTCGSTLKARSECRHHSRIASLSWFSDTDLERAARNVAPIEPDVNGVNAVLPGDETDRMLV